MSRTRFLLTFTPLVSLGLFGVWLGSHFAPSDPRMLLGPLLVLGVIIGLLIVFRRDLREPESEKRADWERTKAKGKRHHVLSQIGLAVLHWGQLFLVLLLLELYWGGWSWDATLRHLRRYAAPGVLVAAICGLWALAWWSYQERKYRG